MDVNSCGVLSSAENTKHVGIASGNDGHTPLIERFLQEKMARGDRPPVRRCLFAPPTEEERRSDQRKRKEILSMEVDRFSDEWNIDVKNNCTPKKGRYEWSAFAADNGVMHPGLDRVQVVDVPANPAQTSGDVADSPIPDSIPASSDITSSAFVVTTPRSSGAPSTSSVRENRKRRSRSLTDTPINTYFQTKKSARHYKSS